MSCTNADQTFNVPSGVSSVNIYVWGAGGGGLATKGDGRPADGGCGGFAYGTIDASSISSLIVKVGQRGKAGESSATYSAATAGTGGVWVTTDVNWRFASGGGASGVYLNTTPLIIAGGGGAGGGRITTDIDGGNGGDLSGQTSSVSASVCGVGGVWNGAGTTTGSNGTDRSGSYGGGGGGGYYRGGRGGFSGGDIGSGGGGSGYYNTTHITSGSFTTGTFGTRTAPNNTNQYYISGNTAEAAAGINYNIASGGLRNMNDTSSANAVNGTEGGNGLIMIHRTEDVQQRHNCH
eukprot:764453-Hanusia_phi.AAC.1